MEHSYIMVEKIGDSILNQKTDFRDLQSYHHINQVDTNLIVQDFSSAVNKHNALEKHLIFNILPKNSTFYLYRTTMDLSQQDYKKTKKTNQILIFKNKIFHFE